MLQQTQMERGVAFFNSWMQKFPDLSTLAAADEETVLKAWEGLGYYSRAKNILRAARHLVANCQGRFPASSEELRTLPGIGPYTAAAIASTAFQENIACIDANVERVISRLFDLTTPVHQAAGRKCIHELAEKLLPQGRAGDHNQAMMELGALVCGRVPQCPICPLATFCRAREAGTQGLRPIKEKKPEKTRLYVASGILWHAGRIFIQKRLADDVWGGLWEFPGGGIETDESPERAVVREFKEETGFAVRVSAKYGVYRHNYTSYLVTLHCFALEPASSPLGRGIPEDGPAPLILSAASQWRWVTPGELKNYAMPSVHRKIANELSAPVRKILLPLA